jgi:uncharacterized membrane protein
MPKLTYKVTVDRPPDQVFDFVANAENNPRWHAHVQETHWLDDRPTALGRRARQTGHLWGRDWAFVAEVAEWEPRHRVTFQVIEGFKARTSLQVEPDGAGTLLTLTVATPPHLGPLDPLVSRVMMRLTAARGRGDVDRLTAALEAEAARP